MNIGKAAKQAGLTTKTVRYYANIGLIVPYQDPSSGYRDYSESDLAKLQFIGMARRFNFSIDECRELLALYEDRNRSSHDVKMLTMQKIDQIKGKIKELESLKDQLSHLAAGCDGDDRPDCPILDALSNGKVSNGKVSNGKVT